LPKHIRKFPYLISFSIALLWCKTSKKINKLSEEVLGYIRKDSINAASIGRCKGNQRGKTAG